MGLEMVRYAPSAALRPFLGECNGYRQDDLQPGQHRGLPSPFLTLIITLDDPLHVNERTYDALIGGLHSAPAIVTHDGRQSGIQVPLSPLGTRALLGIPAGDLANVDVDLTDVLAAHGKELVERVREADSWPERFAQLEAYLLRYMNLGSQPNSDVVNAWRTMRREGGDVEVAALADEAGLSTRRLSSLFHTEIGMSPKAAARVVRFDRARRALQRRVLAGEPTALGELAVSCGYFDQAHLARDFREMAGCPPTQWIAEEFRYFQDADEVAASG